MLALVMLMGIAALAIDGTRLYAEKRHAQNAADNAALAAARALCLDQDFTSAALELANGNGYDNDGTGDIVTVNNPPTSGPYSGNSNYIEVTIVSNFPAALMQFIRPGGLQITARAVGKCMDNAPEGRAALHMLSEGCSNSIKWAGSSGSVQGGLHSNSDIQVSGAGNSLTGIASYVTTIDAPGENLAFLDPLPPGNPIQTMVLEDPLGLDIADYAPGGAKAAIAQGAGQYRYLDGDMTLNWLRINGYYDIVTKVLSDGLYYATGDITIIGADVYGNAVTLVSEGNINFGGPNHVMTSYMDDLLVFSSLDRGSSACGTAVITLSLSGNVYDGVIYAPNGNVSIAGAGVQLTGGVVAYSLSITGSGVSVINSSTFIPPQSGTIEIVE